MAKCDDTSQVFRVEANTQREITKFTNGAKMSKE